MNCGLVLACVVIVGTAAGLVFESEARILIAFAIACGAFAWLEIPSRLRAASLWAAVLFVSAWHGADARDRALVSPLQSWYRAAARDDRGPDTVFIRGELAGDAVRSERGVRLVIDVNAVRLTGEHQLWRRTLGRLQLHVSGDIVSARMEEWASGRRLETPAVLREPQIFRNPGSPSDRWQQLRRTVDLVGTVKSGTLVEVESAGWWDEGAARVRQIVRTDAARYVAPRSSQAAAIMTAILIGDRAGLDDEVQRRLRVAGTYHVIAISGGNVALLTGVSFVFFRLAIRSFRMVALTTLIVVLLYGSIVTGEASVERAVLAASIYLLLSLIGLRTTAVQVAAVTALTLVVVRPLTVIDAGAWLSFGATFGIVIGANRFTSWATRTQPEPSSRLKGPDRPRRSRRIWLLGLGLFASTLAAEVVLAPISAALFSRIGILGLVLNFVAIPVMAVVQFAGLALLACHGWWPSGAALIGHVVAIAGDWLIGSAGAVDSAPWLIWRVPPVSAVSIAIYYAALATAIWPRAPQRVRQMSGLIVVVVIVIIITAPGLESAAPRRRLRVTVLDVGQGDAIVVQLPDGHTLLVDAGGAAGAGDFGGRVVTPALWGLGVRKLDWMAITHPDLDHIGGAVSVERDFSPFEIWQAVPVPPNPESLRLRQDSQSHRVAWRQVLAGQRLDIGSVVLEAVHPPAPDWERRRVRNDDSLVLRLRYGGVEFLLTGDAGAEFEERFNADRDLPMRILKVGHHGSKTASSARFLEAFRPQLALISAGRGNLFGHPAPDVLQRLTHVGTTVFRTDRDGAILIETDGAIVEVTTMTGQTWKSVLPTATPPPVRP